jgi:outer membrane protein assembly factor BamB
VIDRSEIAVLDADTGTTRWTRRLSAAGLRGHAPAAIGDGQVVIPSTSTGYGPVDE